MFPPPNSKITASFLQGTTGSTSYIDIGSCTLPLGYPDYSGINFENQNKEIIQIDDDNPRVQVLGRFSLKLSKNSEIIGYINGDVLYDKEGPKGIKQISLQITILDRDSKFIKKEIYKPKEIHSFDIKTGDIIISIVILEEKLLDGVINKI